MDIILQEFQIQWEIAVSLIYQHALDMLACHPSVHLVIVQEKDTEEAQYYNNDDNTQVNSTLNCHND